MRNGSQIAKKRQRENERRKRNYRVNIEKQRENERRVRGMAHRLHGNVINNEKSFVSLAESLRHGG